MYHGLSSPYDGSVLPHCNPVLLWVVQTNELPLNSRILAKIIKIIGGILTPIVRSQNLELLPYLILHKSFHS